MAWSSPMSKRVTDREDPPRSCRARAAGELVGDVGGQSFRRFGFVQHSIVSRWGEIVGQRYAFLPIQLYALLFHKLQRELHALARKQDARLAAEDRRRIKVFSRAARVRDRGRR